VFEEWRKKGFAKDNKNKTCKWNMNRKYEEKRVKNETTIALNKIGIINETCTRDALKWNKSHKSWISFEWN
jgi:hypothetical protein